MATTTALSSLKLVAAQRPTQKSAIEIKRDKLLARICEQITIANARANGTTHEKVVTRRVKDRDTGEVKTVQALRYPKQWWWTGADGKVYMSVRYGVRVLELAKGKSAIEIGTATAVLPTLEQLKAAVLNAEFDPLLDAIKIGQRTKK